MGNTSHHPPAPLTGQTGGPEADPHALEAAGAFVATLPRLSPALRQIPRGMHDELTRLTARWLAAGHTPSGIRTHILRGLPDDGTPVHRPGGRLHTRPNPSTTKTSGGSRGPTPPTSTTRSLPTPTDPDRKGVGPGDGGHRHDIFGP
ncbi:hypothetical protein ABZV31_10225 [Streptomyces sp. NPDC005202]|uniref:hypothetical protein n=1 Tax=Streptomyces sp. NPDC005202 TaxID=3157021 RepID=UPI0033A2F292